METPSELSSQPLASPIVLATGFGFGWQSRRDYGAGDRQRFYYEIPMYTYVSLGHPFYLRPGLRLFYSNSQPEMPSAIRMSETDFAYLAELGPSGKAKSYQVLVLVLDN